MALERVAVFEAHDIDGVNTLNEFLARSDVRVDKITSSACASKWGHWNYVTVVYWQLETAPEAT